MGLIVLAIIFLIPVAVVAAIILLINKKSTAPFEEKIRTIYLYLIILANLVASIYGLISIITSASNLLFPTTFDNNTIRNNEAIQNLIGSAGIVITCLPIFFIHRKKLIKK